MQKHRVSDEAHAVALIALPTQLSWNNKSWSA